MCFVDQYLAKCEIYKLQTLTVALHIHSINEVSFV